MKKLLTVMAFSVGLFANAQTGNLFKPVKEVALRTPSVPIVVSDPHFSIWSPYDKLYEGNTEHNGRKYRTLDYSKEAISRGFTRRW